MIEKKNKFNILIDEKKENGNIFIFISKKKRKKERKKERKKKRK